MAESKPKISKDFHIYDDVMIQTKTPSCHYTKIKKKLCLYEIFPFQLQSSTSIQLPFLNFQA
ncbi:CLUMA_CG013039, isoform A [Clunio marinus]|uniref:CLUMA_CG013039, isoform A n=1 Tax=Clunio marinus TaxID=568069 RepID=A0A1J1IMG3_9DIPT|nr:CLUMA_CG013039, isoform A [Clunio marinus]